VGISGCSYHLSCLPVCLPHCCDLQQRHLAGVQPDYTNPDKTTLKAADTVQQIRLRPVEPALNEPDLTLRRYNTKRDMRFMRKLQYLTDTTVALEGCGQEWQVHGLMLGSASTVFRHILEDVPPTGKPCSLLSGDNPCMLTDNQISTVLFWNTALCLAVLPGHGAQQVVYVLISSTHVDQLLTC